MSFEFFKHEESDTFLCKSGDDLIAIELERYLNGEEGEKSESLWQKAFSVDAPLLSLLGEDLLIPTSKLNERSGGEIPGLEACVKCDIHGEAL